MSVFSLCTLHCAEVGLALNKRERLGLDAGNGATESFTATLDQSGVCMSTTMYSLTITVAMAALFLCSLLLTATAAKMVLKLWRWANDANGASFLTRAALFTRATHS